VFFEAAACPSGWAPYDKAAGRYLVSAAPGGAVGDVVGAALGAAENRATGQHDHAISDPGHNHNLRVSPIYVGGNVTASRVAGTTGSYGNDLPAFNVADPFNGAIKPQTTGITVLPSAGPAGTNAPYVQLLACRRS
jgi:hypothetical protein